MLERISEPFQLEELTACLSEASDYFDSEEETREFLKVVYKLRGEIHDMYEFSSLLMRDRLSQRQLKFLQDLRYKFNPAMDISVRFFGMDWAQMRGLLKR